MHTIEAILQEASHNNWPFHRRFAVLKEAGVTACCVSFIDAFEYRYEGSFGVWREPVPADYKSLVLAEVFSEEGFKAALSERMEGKTSYFEFLAAIAAQGVSHYKIDMNSNTITYFNNEEDRYCQQTIPVWKE